MLGALEAPARKPLHETAVTRARRVQAPRPEFPGEPRGEQGEREAEPDTQHERQVLPVRIIEAEGAQQVLLLQAIELDNPVVPACIDVVPDHSGLPPQPIVGPESVAKQVAGQRCFRPALNARRRNGGGRIEAGPPGIRQPDLGPGMRMRLAQNQVAADWIPVATLVAGDDPRRNAGGAHHHREGRREMPAESLACVEQEIVDRVALETRRCQCVVKLLVAEHREHGAREFAVASGRLAHAPGELDGARVAARRQLQVHVAKGSWQPRTGLIARPGARFVLQHRIDGTAGAKLIVPGLLCHRRRPMFDHVEREQHALAGRFERDRVVDGLAEVADARPEIELALAARPGVAVELVQHRAAPVAFRRRWRWALEAYAECDRVILRQLRNVARRHLFREAGQRAFAGRRTPETAGDARKEQEQHERDRQRLQQHRARYAKWGK